jgi:DNA-binding beta-propeller fold protein YncE
MKKQTIVRSAAASLLLVSATVVSLGAADPNNPTGSKGLILVDKRGHYVRFFDPKTEKELSSFPTGQGAAHDLAISPDLKTAYIPVYGDGVYNRNPNPGQSILIVDLGSQKLAGTIDIAPYQAPHGIQIDARGKLYVVCDISRKLLVIDPAARKIESVIDIEGTGHWIAVLPDASKAYVSNQSGQEFISVVDLKTRTMIGKIPVAGGARGIVASSDGKRVFAIQGQAPHLVVIDPASDTILDRIELQGHTEAGYKLRASLDGRTLLICSGIGGMDSYINILDVGDLRGKQQVLRAGKSSMGFAFAPDGQTALVLNDGDGTVTVIDLKSKTVRNTFKGGTGIETASYY